MINTQETPYNTIMNNTPQYMGGWSNKPTWNISMVYGDVFTTMAKEQEFEDALHMATSFKSLVHDMEHAHATPGSLAADTLDAYLSQVDWSEIAADFYDLV